MPAESWFQMSDIAPWLSEDLPPQNKKTSLVDDLCYYFEKLWKQDEDDFRRRATSYDKASSAGGSVTIDKVITAYLLKKEAGPGTRVGDAEEAEITRVMHHVQARFNMSRKQIAERAANLEIEASKPVEDGGVA